jgi:hypothetical protein
MPPRPKPPKLGWAIRGLNGRGAVEARGAGAAERLENEPGVRSPGVARPKPPDETAPGARLRKGVVARSWLIALGV